MTALPKRPHSEAVELELIRSVATCLLPAVIMSVGFALTGALIVWVTRDPLLLTLLLAGVTASIARLGAAIHLARRGEQPDFTIDLARRMELNFRLGYAAFALLLGLFGMRCFLLGNQSVHVLAMCLLIGYAAGVAATVALRPNIAISAMLLSLMPTIAVAALSFDPLYVGAGLMTTAFVIGGIRNLIVRHGQTVEEIALRINFGNIARKDGLTALANRIALREWYEQHSAMTDPGALVAVHYLDLDGFKPINDRFGHAFGDALLVAVGQRLSGMTRETDIAARLGGDEFAVVQFGLAGERDAEHLAGRLRHAISQPFQIKGEIVEIGTSVGYVVTQHHATDLEQLITQADQALYTSKRRGGGISRHEGSDARRAA